MMIKKVGVIGHPDGADWIVGRDNVARIKKVTNSPYFWSIEVYFETGEKLTIPYNSAIFLEVNDER
ncbi:hypothetical protein EQG49_02405 [Periweissella cryptocerci]|uniref:Uncharacterized protein n=1 Tax=Periweissella cryptocerci TaxID=2506420 RepID=A0A4P6YRZ0_9LACO|nr:hypothetical protein [Periweissella cryptocerci]QBO35396.1 hypothetical protein EQG49_02405 [Periweissella cryptocerci]